jgi:hypothetical protein
LSEQAAAALGRRLDEILAQAEQMIRAVPEAEMSTAVPAAGVSLRDLAFRLFRLGLGFTDGMDLGRFSEEWRREPVPDDLRDGAAVARYGALVRGRLGGWLEGAGPGEFSRVILADGRPIGGLALLERVASEADRQFRLMQAALARSGRVS